MLLPRLYGENLFDDFFDDFPFFDNRNLKRAEKKLYGNKANRLMCTDIKENDNGFEMEMDLPGFTKDEVQLSLENGYLTVEAKKDFENRDAEQENSRYIRRERFAGVCSRSFYVGDAVTQEDIKARFEHGILKLEVPKKEKQAVEQKKYIAIEG